MTNPSHVPVADTPNNNAPTYADILTQATLGALTIHGQPWTDSRTPDGHFGVTVTGVGGFTDYWLKGERGTHTAVIVARTQFITQRDGRQQILHYTSGGWLGGQLAPLPAKLNSGNPQ